MKFDAELISFATQRELDYIKAIEQHGSERRAAKELGIARQSIQASMLRLKQRAAIRGYSPAHDMSHTVPDGYKVKGVSTYYNAEGKPTAQWVKSSADEERRTELVRQFIEGLCEQVKGLAPKVEPPKFAVRELLTVYPIGDHHHGMYADADETGSNYDSKIAATLLDKSVSYLSELAPASEEALLINLGDFFHANDSKNETPEHANRLDVDTRFGQVMLSGAWSLVRAVLVLLKKHQRVHVWNLRGNHDPDAAMALSIAMAFYFHNEPRVIVDTGPSLYKYMRFGKCLIGAHHGHGAKAQDLPLVMADDRKEDWGQTDHRVWHCGHIHHLSRKDFTGCTVETHRTLAGTDAWHAGKGYRSKKDMNAIVYHTEHGEIQRTRFDAGMAK